MTKKLLIIAIAIFGLGIFNSSAQATKFGHVDYVKILDSLPSKMAADKDLENFMAEGQKTIAEMQADFEADYKIFLEEQDTYSKVIKEMKEKALMEKQQLLQYKQESLENDLQILNKRLYEPLEANIKLAVASIAKQHKLNYVMEVNNLLFVDGGVDITKEVKVELTKLEAARSK